MQPMSAWITQAICRNVRDPDIFFPSVGGKGRQQAAHTKLICEMCPVQQDCLDYAIAHDEEGFWGGKTKTDRESLPAFIREFIKLEYERLGLMEHRLNIDGLIASMRLRLREEQSQEDEYA